MNEYTMDLFLRLQWHDDRLKYNYNLGNESLRIDPSNVWTPDIYFYNKAGNTEVLDQTLKISSNGSVFWSRHFIAKFTTVFQLEDFPFDTQKLTFKLVSFSHDKKVVDIRFFADAEGGPVYPPVKDTFSSALWKLTGGLASESSMEFLMARPSFDLLYYSITVSRYSSIYCLKYVVPLILVALCTSLSYWISQEAIPARVGLGLSLIIANITLNFIIQTDLPKVSYATNMDEFISCIFLFTFIVLLEFVISHYIHCSGNKILSILIDKTFRLWAPLMVLHSLGILLPKGDINDIMKWVMFFCAILVTITIFGFSGWLYMAEVRKSKENMSDLKEV
jgi:gamma-aminobutyric acid receptor subunit delta